MVIFHSYVSLPEGMTYCGWLRNPNHQLIGGKHPIFYRLETTIQSGAGFRNHPPYVTTSCLIS